ncbi:MAG: hypothetical protein SRB2_01920 [Desulfobacteraceae bacterium Eth-SRB2]|nr:MAG: hypothetical protein SRB2_01920 [Desulfobacteraceae bacterium Eth-SRB2]
MVIILWSPSRYGLQILSVPWLCKALAAFTGSQGLLERALTKAVFFDPQLSEMLFQYIVVYV